MNKKYDAIKFLLKCILIPAAAVLIIFALNKPYRKIDADKYLDIDKFTTLEAVYDEVQIGNLGSSHGAYDFDYTLLEERGYSCFNFANTSQSYNYDYAILKEYGHYMTKGSVMFIPVSYFSFNNEVINESEAQAMSLRYYHFLSPENIPGYDPYIDLVTNRLPVLSAGEDILKIFPDLKLSITADAAEVYTDEANDTANNIDTAAFAARAKERYSRHFDNKEEYFMPERIEELYNIINYCLEHEITPVLITTPFSSYYTTLVSEDFLDEFNATVSSIVNDTNVSYYDYSRDARFNDKLEYFADCDHLNEAGCEYFMRILADEVTELSVFP